MVNVGATPGLTRSMQEVNLDKNIKLLDCPGVVMLRSGENEASVALRNCKKIEKLEDPIWPGNLLIFVYLLLHLTMNARTFTIVMVYCKLYNFHVVRLVYLITPPNLSFKKNAC